MQSRGNQPLTRDQDVGEASFGRASAPVSGLGELGVTYRTITSLPATVRGKTSLLSVL